VIVPPAVNTEDTEKAFNAETTEPAERFGVALRRPPNRKDPEITVENSALSAVSAFNLVAFFVPS
jgi:hypothetical protein